MRLREKKKERAHQTDWQIPCRLCSRTFKVPSRYSSTALLLWPSFGQEPKQLCCLSSYKSGHLSLYWTINWTLYILKGPQKPKQKQKLLVCNEVKLGFIQWACADHFYSRMPSLVHSKVVNLRGKKCEWQHPTGSLSHRTQRSGQTTSIPKIRVIQELGCNVWSSRGSQPGLPQQPHSGCFFSFFSFFFHREEEQQRRVSLFTVCTSKRKGWESPHSSNVAAN